MTKTHATNFLAAVSTLLLAVTASAQGNSKQSPQRDISTREMERANWMEFREYVPGRIQTVLLPAGTKGEGKTDRFTSSFILPPSSFVFTARPSSRRARASRRC